MKAAAHLDPSRLAGLSLLDGGDPERAEAEAHARECDPCRRALAEAARAMSLLDALPPPAPPSEVALRRALDAVHAQMHVEAQVETQGEARATATGAARVETKADSRVKEPAATRAWARPLLGVAAMAAWGVSLLVARHRDESGTSLSLAGALVAGAGALFTLARDRLALGLLLAASVALAGYAAGEGGLFPEAGVLCALHEVACALVPLGAAAWLARSGRVAVGPLSLAAAAAAGAFAGQAALHVACRVAHATPHLAVFHVGGVVASALVGAALSRVGRLRPARS